MEDSKGNLWIGNNGMGVLKYDEKNVVNFTAQQKLE
jgi:ligand-binding sensor domain-containing protein